MGIFEDYLSQIEETVTEPENITMPETQVQADGRPRLHTEEELKEFLKPTLLEKTAKFAEEPLRLGANYLGGLYDSFGHMSKDLGYVTGLVGENPISDILYKAGGDMESIGKTMKEEGYDEGLAKKVYGALGEATGEVTKLVGLGGVAGPAALPLAGFVSNARAAKEAGKSSREQLEAGLLSIPQNVLMHGILKANALLPGRFFPKASSAATFYMITPGSVEDKLASAATMGMITGRGTTGQEFMERYKWGRNIIERERATKEMQREIGDTPILKLLERASEAKPKEHLEINSRLHAGLEEIKTRQTVEPAITEPTNVSVSKLRNRDFILAGQLPPENMKAIEGYGLKRFQDLITDVRKNGIKEPIDIIRDKEGNIKIYDGQHRLVAADIVGLKDVPVTVRKVEGSVFDYGKKPSTVIEKEVYHVSDHDFNQFDITKAGGRDKVGVDSETLGPAHYFSVEPSKVWLTGNAGVAYKTKIKGDFLDYDAKLTELQRQKVLEEISKTHVGKPLKGFEKEAAKYSDRQEFIKKFHNPKAYSLENITASKQRLGELWDSVRKRKLDMDINRSWNGGDLTANLELKLGNPELVRQFLDRAGIAGMAYTDITMMSKSGFPQKSYAVYHDKSTKILSKNYIAKDIYAEKPMKGEDVVTAKMFAAEANRQLLNKGAAIEKGHGKKYKKAGIFPTKNPFIQLRKYFGSAGIAEQCMKHGVYIVNQQTGEVELVAEPINKVFKDFAKQTKIPLKNAKAKKVLDKYMEAKRLMSDTRVSDQKKIEARAILEKIAKDYPNEATLLDKTAQRVMGYYRDGLLRILKEAGYTNQEQIEAMMRNNPFYVPFEHLGSFDRWGKPIKTVDMLTEDIESIVDITEKLTHNIVSQAQKNVVKQSIFGLKDISGFETEVKEIKGRAIESEANKENRLSVYVNGEKRFMEVSPEMKMAIDSLTPESASMAIRMMAPFARSLQVGITADPFFGLANFARDQFTAWMQTDIGFIPFVDSLVSVAHILGKTKTFQDWVATGGSYSGYTELSRKKSRQRAERTFKAKKPNVRVIDSLQAFNEVLENATRVGVFRAAQRKGLMKRFGMGTPAVSAQEAGIMSREGTIDFAVYGAKMAGYKRTTAFANPAVQGTAKLIRTVRDKKLATTMKGISMLTLPTLLLYLVNRNDEEYWEFSPTERNMKFHFKIDGKWYAVPKPPGWGTMYSTIPQRFMRYIDKQDPHAFEQVEKDILEIITPFGDNLANLVPTAIAPMLAMYANKNAFWGTPLVPPHKEKMPAQYQYTRNTPEVVKRIGKELKISPAKLYHLIQSWGGKIGKYGVTAINEGYKLFMPPDEKRALRPQEMADLPGVDRFARKSPMQYPWSIQRFYNDLRKLEGWNSSYHQMVREGNNEDAKDILKAHPEIRMYGKAVAVRKQLSTLNQLIERVLQSDIDDEEKKGRLLELDKRRLAIAKRANSIIWGRIHLD